MRFRYLIILAGVISLIFSLGVMRAAWLHNSQGEIHQDGIVDWAYLLLIGASWAVCVFIVLGGIISFAWLIAFKTKPAPKTATDDPVDDGHDGR